MSSISDKKKKDNDTTDVIRIALEESNISKTQSTESFSPNEDLVEELSVVTAIANIKENEERNIEPSEEEILKGLSAVTAVSNIDDFAEVQPFSTDQDSHHYQSMARTLEMEANASTSSRRAALLLHELGRIYEYNFNDSHQALHYYRESFEKHKGLAVNARALGRILLKNQQFTEAIHAFSAELDIASNRYERAAIFLQRAIIRSHALHEYAAAKNDLERVLDIDPQNSFALDMLISICSKLKLYHDAKTFIERRIEATTSTELVSQLYCDLAQVLKELPEQVSEVETVYRSALNADKANIRALNGLYRHAQSQKNYALLTTTANLLAKSQPPQEAAAIYFETARVYQYKLDNRVLALEALERATKLAPADSAILMELADTYEKEERFEDLAIVLTKAINETEDSSGKARLAYRLARIRYEKLDDIMGAIDALKLAANETQPPIYVITMLGRLYAKTGKHEDQAALLRKELSFHDDPETQSRILLRLGRLYEEHLCDRQNALNTYRSALITDKNNQAALQCLVSIYKEEENWDELIGIYEDQLEQTKDSYAKVVLLRKIADIWEHSKNEPFSALFAYERILVINPSFLPAINGLHRIYAQSNRYNELTDALANEAKTCSDTWRKVAILTERATVLEEKLNSTTDALEAYLDVLSEVPSYQPALIAAGKLLKKIGNYTQLVALHEKEFDATEDRNHRIWLLLKIGRIYFDKLKNPKRAIRAFSDAIDLGDTSDAASCYLLNLYQSESNFTELAHLLDNHASEHHKESHALSIRRIAENYLRAGRTSLAIEHYRRALRIDNDIVSADALTRIFVENKDKASLLQLCQQRAQLHQNRSHQIEALHHHALLLEEEPHHLKRSAETYTELLKVFPYNQILLKRLEGIFVQLEEYDELAAVIELSSTPSEDQDYRSACSLLVSALYEHRLGDLNLAAESAVSVLEHQPTNSEALSTLERHARTFGNIGRLIEVNSRLLRDAQTIAEQAAIVTLLANSHANLGEYTKAFELFHMALTQDPEYFPAARGNLLLAQSHNDTQTLALAYSSLGHASHHPKLAAQSFNEAAKLHQDQKDLDAALKAYQYALNRRANDLQAFQGIAQILTIQDQNEELVSLYDKQIHLSQDNNTKKDLLVRKANLQRGKLNDSVGARRSINRALQIFPNDLKLLSTLAELCRTSQDWTALAQVNTRLAAVVDDNVLLAALHFELGELFEEKLEKPLAAIAAYEKAIALDKKDKGALRRLANLLVATHSWQRAIIVFHQLIAHDDDRENLKNYHLQLSKIYSEGLFNDEEAINAARRALTIIPEDIEATHYLADLLERKGDSRSLFAHIESALSIYRIKIEQNPTNLSPYQALASIFKRRGATDHKSVVDALIKALTKSASHRENIHSAKSDILATRPPTDDEIDRFLLHQKEQGALFELLSLANPLVKKALTPKEVKYTKAKLTAKSHPSLYQYLRLMTKLLTKSRFESYLSSNVDKIEIIDANPTVVYFNPSLDPNNRIDRYWITHAIAGLRLSHAIYFSLRIEEFEQLMACIVSLNCEKLRPDVPSEAYSVLYKSVEKAAAKRLRAKLKKPSEEICKRPFSPQKWRNWMRESQDRLALAITGDAWAAIKAITEDEGFSSHELSEEISTRVKRILSFIVSDEHLTLRARLKTGD